MDGAGAAGFSPVEHKRHFFWCAFSALTFNGISGDYAEFGCHGAVTFGLAYEQVVRRPAILGRPAPPCHLWAFDSFEGLPERAGAEDEHPLWQRGMFAMDVDTFHRQCAERGVPRDAYSVVPGFYDRTLRGAAPAAPPADIALAYVDCDMYSSTRDVLEYLRPRLKHGMIIAFDDYFCFSDRRVSGEKAAFEELRAGEPGWHFERYRDIGWAGASFVVEAAAGGG